MRFYATVMCNCWKLGLTTEPPFPRDCVQLDQNGYLNLRPEFDNKDYWSPFLDWIQNCCAHQRMDYASEYISNGTGHTFFRQALERAGAELFPVLCAELSKAYGGQTYSAQSKLALIELERFKQLPSLGQDAALVDESGYVLFEHIAARYKGVFFRDMRSDGEGVDIGIGESEFFIKDRKTHADIFRARRVRQTLLDCRTEDTRYKGRVEFLNLDSGATCTTTTALTRGPIPWPDGRMQNDQRQLQFIYPTEFHVEIRNCSPSSFEYILQPLLKIFAASVETGNPVRWH
jgi:hypothetical protein